MKKIAIKNTKNLYVIRDAEGMYCDFCGEVNKGMFESEFEDDPKNCGNTNMQICYDCVIQLNKLIK
jgi:hypothetical protein